MYVALEVDVRMRADRDRSKDGGFTVIELLMVLVMMGTVLAIGLGGFTVALDTVRGDASMNVVLWQLKLARETAINQRRSVRVTFTEPNYMTVVRQNIPSGTTLISTAVLEHQTKFYVFSNMPDTPDGFGKANAIDFGTATEIRFNSEGQLTNQLGAIINGSVFIAKPSSRMTARALTVFGPTSTIRTYRWNGTAWKH